MAEFVSRGVRYVTPGELVFDRPIVTEEEINYNCGKCQEFDCYGCDFLEKLRNSELVAIIDRRTK